MSPPLALIMVLDAVGIPTLERMLKACQDDIALPNLARFFGLGRLLNACYHQLVPLVENNAYAAAVLPVSTSADSVINHREMMGLVDGRSYGLFHKGFPPKFVAKLEHRAGRRMFFNQLCGGEDAIKLNMAEHLRTKQLILYASNCDPLLQIAALESICPPEELAAIAEEALKLAQEMEVGINRAISRPFILLDGGRFKRTSKRHDATLPLPHDILTHLLRRGKVRVSGIGKIKDLLNTDLDEVIRLGPKAKLNSRLGACFVERVIDNNPFSLQGTLCALHNARTARQPALVFTNFVDTDQYWGHSGKLAQAAKSVAAFDRALPLVTKRLRQGDLVIVTADHGILDKAHHKEEVPLLVVRVGYGPDLGGLAPGQTPGLTQVGDLVAQLFGCADEYRRNILHAISTTKESSKKRRIA